MDSVSSRFRHLCELFRCAVYGQSRQEKHRRGEEKANICGASVDDILWDNVNGLDRSNYTFITLIPRTEQLGLNTGSVTSFNTCGSSACVLITKR